jgi:hypothetical protein
VVAAILDELLDRVLSHHSPFLLNLEDLSFPSSGKKVKKAAILGDRCHYGLVLLIRIIYLQFVCSERLPKFEGSEIAILYIFIIDMT